MGCLDPRELLALEATLEPIARQAERLGIPWVLVGAAARDLILAEEFSSRASRRTNDVDVAIGLPDWNLFQRLSESLRKLEGISPEGRVPHRFSLPDGSTLDLIPFGGIAVDGLVEWPSDRDTVLDVLGFPEALRTARTTTLPGGLGVRVPELELYLCLKLFAWRGRHLRKPLHDSVDIREVMEHVGDRIPLEELYARHPEAMERNDYDSALACLELMGNRLRADLSTVARDSLLQLLTDEADENGRLELVRELGATRASLHKLQALRNGLSRKGLLPE